MMEGFRLPGPLAPSASQGKVSTGQARKQPACSGDNVLGGHPAEATSFVPTRREEYRKVFGAASVCSIPVLDLPPLSDGCSFLSCSALDYLDIFGGFDAREFGVPYEELFSDAAADATQSLSPPKDPTVLSTNEYSARRSKEKRCLTPEIQIPRCPAGDAVCSSSSAVANCLSHGAEQTAISRHMVCCSYNVDTLIERKHKNEISATSTSAIVLEHTNNDASNSQEKVGFCLPYNHQEAANEQYLRKTVASTSYNSREKHPQIDMKSESRPSRSAFSSSDRLKTSRSNESGSNLSDSHSLHENLIAKKKEDKWKNNASQSTTVYPKTENDLKVPCVASEPLPADEALFPRSSSDHACFSSPGSLPNRLSGHINIDALGTGTTGANHSVESILRSLSCTSSQSSDYETKAEEKHFTTMHKFMEVPPVHKSHQLYASQSRQSFPSAALLTVSDVVLQTQPSERPPPSRPPPAKPPPSSDPDVCRTSGKFPSFGSRTEPPSSPPPSSTGLTAISNSLKQTMNDILPPSHGANLSGGSRAVTSVAAIKEAIEIAEARIKCAKLSVERKENLRLKSRINDGCKSRQVEKNKMFQEDQINREGVLIQPAEKDEEKELETSRALCVSTEDEALTRRDQEDTNINCITRSESSYFHENSEMESDTYKCLFEQCKSEKSNIMQRTIQHEKNEAGPKSVQKVYGDIENREKIDKLPQSAGWKCNQSEQKKIQELSLSSEKDLCLDDAGLSIAPVGGVGDCKHGVVASTQGEYKSRINEDTKESRAVLDPVSYKQPNQVSPTPRPAIPLEKQWHICTSNLENNAAEWLDNFFLADVTEEAVNKESMETEAPKNPLELERGRSKFETNDRAPRLRLEEISEEVVRIEENKSGMRRDLEEEYVTRRSLEEEKDLESSLEDERQRERMSQDADGKYRGEEEKMHKVEEKERRVTEEGKSKDNEQERNSLKEQDMKGSILDEIDKTEKKLEEEEVWILAEERERERTEQVDGHAKTEYESERVEVEEKMREERKEQPTDVEKKMMEGEIKPEMINSEVEKYEWETEDMQTVGAYRNMASFIEIRDTEEILAVEMLTVEGQQAKLGKGQGQEEECWSRDSYHSDTWGPDLQVQSSDAPMRSQKFPESSDAPITNIGGPEVDSSPRCKARSERHQRTTQRMATALSEKHMRDIATEREQAERRRLAETLDADVRRWSNGKEGNLRALLSTLQYILGPESGWQPIPLTDVITDASVKKAYRKAMLYVHPDKLQQRSANIQQKYICEKVFDLLKEAWSRFNSEEW